MVAHRRRNAAWYARHRAAILERRRTAYEAGRSAKQDADRDEPPQTRRQRGRPRASSCKPHKAVAVLIDELAALAPIVSDSNLKDPSAAGSIPSQTLQDYIVAASSSHIGSASMTSTTNCAVAVM